jgi:hypothetical protein
MGGLMMKYKVGDKVRVRKDLVIDSVYGGDSFPEGMAMFRGKVVTISKRLNNGKYYILEDNSGYAWTWTNEMFEGLANEAPSIVKRINDKHHILNGLLNSDGSVDGEKLMEKLSNQSNDSNDSNDMAKGSHYEKSAMQPLEVSQVLLTKEQFEGALLFNIIKYRMRKKGQRESDEYKARQYAYWLEMVKDGHIINPSKDKVPSDYRFSII